MRYYGKRRGNTLIRLTALLLVPLIGLLFCFYKMRPVLINYAISNAETIMLDAANKAVLEILNDNDISYSDIVTLSRNEAGQVTSLQTDIKKINTFKSLISNKLSSIIAQKEYYDLYIPAGTFLSSVYTNGFGPKLHFKMQVTATAKVNFSHEFKSAGINQVLHIVMIDMEVNGGLVTAGCNKGITVKTSAVAAQTIIVGAVPGAFTQVIEGTEKSVAELINDYGAANIN